MDLEPGRCRRTDGKKWRCSRNVLPDQKYCERHMHRGRQRSRKHVEGTEKFSNSSAAKTISSKKTTTILNYHIITKTSSNSVTTPSSNTSHKVCSAAKTVSTTSSYHNIRNNGNLNLMNNSSPESTYITTNDGNNDSFNLKKSRKNILSYSTAATVAPKSDVPPMSVLRRGVGCGTSSRALSETGPQRCKRTDGRKWRCSSHVQPEQKYCEQHMHRGVKKLLPAADSVTVALSSPPLAISKKTNNGINLNTGLSVSPGISSDENSSTSGSSSSDATTITDESTSDTSKYIVRARISNV